VEYRIEVDYNEIPRKLRRLARKSDELRDMVINALGEKAVAMAGSNVQGAVLNVRSGRLVNSLRADSGMRGGSFFVGSNVKYAAIHEFGGTTHPRVTGKMRRWAWAKFYETGDSKFKGIALTPKARLDVPIPERPYIKPALDDLFSGTLHQRIARSQVRRWVKRYWE
jgi:phage gpG-like protein